MPRVGQSHLVPLALGTGRVPRWSRATAWPFRGPPAPGQCQEGWGLDLGRGELMGTVPTPGGGWPRCPKPRRCEVRALPWVLPPRLPSPETLPKPGTLGAIAPTTGALCAAGSGLCAGVTDGVPKRLGVCTGVGVRRGAGVEGHTAGGGDTHAAVPCVAVSHSHDPAAAQHPGCCLARHGTAWPPPQPCSPQPRPEAL